MINCEVQSEEVHKEKMIWNLEIENEGIACYVEALGGDKVFLNKVSKVEKKTIMEKAHDVIILNLGDRVM